MKRPASINRANSLGIDAIRILSIFAVVAGHYIVLTGKYDASGLPFPIQSYGVVTMFTLSGFLITFSIYRKTDGLSDFSRYRFTNFLIDRGSRIFVVYWPVLIMVMVANHYVSAHYGMTASNSDAGTLAVNSLMLQLHPLLPAAMSARMDTMDPTWALALEWWIYLFVGWAFLVIYAQIKQSRQRGAAAVQTWAVVALILLSAYPLSRLIGTGTASSALAWFVGAAVFFLYDKIHVTRRTRWAYLCAGVVLTAACVYAIASHTEGYSVSAIYSLYSYLLTGAWFLCFLVFGRGCSFGNGRAFSAASRTATFFSGYMYSLFLTHYSVWTYLHYASPSVLSTMSARDRLIVEFVIANVVAIVVGLLFEKRGQRVGSLITNRYQGSALALRRTF